MRDLTRRQEEILNLIREWMETTGLPPTRAEIAQHFGFSSPNAAEQHLKGLAKKGVLDLVPGTSRGIRLKGDGGVPLVGQVAAGSPILAQETSSGITSSTPRCSLRAQTTCSRCAA